jgi:glutamine phosphoribosylpyrophosphate amidotransferase
MKDKCGVVGIRFDAEKNRDAAALYIYYALQALQHRGQESSGISVTNGNSVLSDKGMGRLRRHRPRTVFYDRRLPHREQPAVHGHL